MTILQTFGTNTINWVAACQQACLVSCLYRGRKDVAEELVSKDGQILEWVRARPTWPPAFCVVRTTEDHYFVCFEGTTNLTQFGSHALGTFSRSGIFPGCLTNGAWWQAWIELRWLINAVVPEGLPPGRIHFSGHSYGSGVAFVAGTEFAVGGDQGVEVLTFAEPKSLTAGYSGPALGCHWRVLSQEDPIVAAPPSTLNYWSTTLLYPVLWERQTEVWQDYGTEFKLDQFGGVDTNVAAQFPPGRLVSLDTVSQHYIDNYVGRLLQMNANSL